MKLLKEVEVGGEVVQKDEGFFGCSFEFAKAGETKKKLKTSTYEGVLQIPFQVDYEETVSPMLDVNGKPKKESDNPMISRLSIDLPFDVHGGRGTVVFYSYDLIGSSLDENELGKRLIQALGNEVFLNKLPKCRD